MSGVLAAPTGNPLATEEATVQDLKLAEALGYERLTDIRKLIKRHLPMLEVMGLVRHRGVPIVSGKGRTTIVTEYQLTKAQTAFITAKAGTKNADSLTVFMAETFAMVLDGKLVAADEGAAQELAAARIREARRRYEEELIGPHAVVQG
ncbi:hypothetical protein [Methylobacterium sp. Leaf88]|uniref:hypothetical protein n=1 Tax=Methylobacterium sp. Leaf88 TaxID=1736244 RepID=UPI0006FDDC38|nr:hypothetical protein [Methylobacterium sp. Leaf88]KQO70356.1 hypothetical protein ASF20_05190 [Methylobacterium sp. Leaf88]